MIEAVNLSQVVSRRKMEPLHVLDHVTFTAPDGHVLGIIGATGSGKTTLLEVLAGLQKATSGALLLNGRETPRLHPNVIGHVPAGDDCLHGGLTVRESMMSASFLRVDAQTRGQRIDKTSHLLVVTGLETVARERVANLDPAQRRRLKLALALVSDPVLVICDDFTDDLDVRSERELAVLLKLVAGDIPGRVVIASTRSLGIVSSFDTVLVLHEGRVCFHGPSRAMTHYFSVASAEELYPRLAKRPAQRWGDSWSRHRDSYYNAFKLGSSGEALARASEDDEKQDPDRITLPSREEAASTSEGGKQDAAAPELPCQRVASFGSQASHLIRRRWTLLRRNRREWLSQAGLLIGAPVLMALMLWPNVTYLKPLMEDARGSLAPDVLWPAAYTCTMALLVQVLLVAAMALRNGAREIARERSVFERERTAGLRASAYLAGKLGYVMPMVLVQAFTLGLFIEIATGGLPGYVLARLVLLALTGLAVTSLCLGVSSRCTSPERAHSLCWTFLALNLMLAGALLGFPRVLGAVIQPLITLYYGWSGSVDTLHGTPVFAPFTQLVRTWFATPSFAMLMLAVHFIAGIILTATGLARRR